MSYKYIAEDPDPKYEENLIVVMHWCPVCNDQVDTYIKDPRDNHPYLLRCRQCDHEWWNGSDR